MNQILQKLIETGIPIIKAQFHAAVNNADQVPEHHFSSESDRPSRRVKMWLTPQGLICYQKSALKKECYWIVPLPTIIFAIFDTQTDLIPPKDFFEESSKIMTHESIAIAESKADDIIMNLPKKRGRPFKNPQ